MVTRLSLFLQTSLSVPYWNNAFSVFFQEHFLQIDEFCLVFNLPLPSKSLQVHLASDLCMTEIMWSVTHSSISGFE